jgi:hypothetical protein
VTKKAHGAAVGLKLSSEFRMVIRQRQLSVFADYFQFYVQDEDVDGDLTDFWTTEATAIGLAVGLSAIGISTARNMTVPVNISIHDTEPKCILDEWDRVAECGMRIESRTIVIAGCTEYFPAAARIDIEPGDYCVRVCSARLDSLSENGLEGEDSYSLFLWKGARETVTVAKQHAIRVG